MVNAILSVDLAAVLNGNIFGYLLHAAEIAAAEGMFGIYLKRRNRFAVRAIVCVALYLACSVGLGILFERVFPYFRFLATYLLSLVFFHFCFKVDLWDGLFCCISAVIAQNLAYSLSGIVVGLMGWDPVKAHWLYSSIQSVIYVAVHIGCFFFGVKKLKDLDAGFGKERFLIVIAVLILTVIIYILQYDRQSLSAPDYLLWRAMFICYDIISLIMLLGIYDRNKLRRENAILNSLRASQEKQYEFDKRTMEMVSVKCHDLKHQIIALRSMGEGEREKVIKDLEETVANFYSIVKTGCKPLDVILSNKYLLCEKYGISFTWMAEGEKLAFMDTIDIYSLFGNAIDNAILAETNIVDEDKRFIDIVVSERGGFLFIGIENYCEKQLVFRNGLPVTTKKDAENHGFGLISIKRIVEKYGGVMTVECKDKLFSLNITISLSDN